MSFVPEELHQWIKSLNPGPHIENWRVFDSNEDPTGRRFIHIVDWDSATAFKRTIYKIFTGLSWGTIKFLSNPEVKTGAG